MPNDKKEIAATTAEPKVDEIQKKEEQKSNLEKAIKEAQEELRVTREATKNAKKGVVTEELPQLDMNDPSTKAWDKHIRETTAPLTSDIEKQKDEVRTFALRRFLQTKPELARNPEKLKELMSTYDRLKVATEQTQEGVLIDLGKAYGAISYDEIESHSYDARLERAKEDMIAADIGISRGATSETTQTPVKRRLSPEEQRIVEQWETMGAPKMD